MRRTKATLIYQRTKNLRAVQLLLGHSKLESLLRSPSRRRFDVEVPQAQFERRCCGTRLAADWRPASLTRSARSRRSPRSALSRYAAGQVAGVRALALTRQVMAACGSPGSGKAQKSMYQVAGPTREIR